MSKQVETAIAAGAGLIQYRNKSFQPSDYGEIKAVRDCCKCNRVPFVINDDVLLAKAVGADGVHLGQDDASCETARMILGCGAIVGASVSTLQELSKTDLSQCDYIGTGPVFATKTKADAKKVIGLSGLKEVVQKSPLPVIAIGGIDHTNAASCIAHGASGVAVISAVTRSPNPEESAAKLARALKTGSPGSILRPWNNEFALISRLLSIAGPGHERRDLFRIPPGDDACLLTPFENPVITTDTQKENVHFRLNWQSPEEVGEKAVSVALSDLAASFARPVALFVNLALPSYASDQTAEALYKGIDKGLKRYGCALGGGNISRGEQLDIDLFAIGEGFSGKYPARDKARQGEGLFSTGPLGLARAGLYSLLYKDGAFPSLIRAFKRPRARFDAAEVLFRHGVACAMDISDGLAGDAGHIAEASGLSVFFNVGENVIDPTLNEFCKKHRLPPKEMVISGGEDYEILFSCSDETFAGIRKELPEAVCVGRLEKFEGVYLKDLPPNIKSYQHGAE